MTKWLITLVLSALGILDGYAPEDRFCAYVEDATEGNWDCRRIQQWFDDHGLADVLEAYLDDQQATDSDSEGAASSSISNGF